MTSKGSTAETKDPSALLPEITDYPEPERKKVKLKYPRSVFFIISNEFCERFSYYGMRTVLFLYLHFVLGYSSDNSTVIYHTFTMFCYFFPLLGAILADSLLGKFRTIFYLSVIYAVGNIVVSVASAGGAIDLPAREISMLGLLLIAVGTGGIKPCVSAFGGDQFVLPQQERQLQRFFSLFYFAINSGSLISTFLTPLLRQEVSCLGQDTCYPLAFGVPAALMIIAIVIFVAGKSKYVIKKPAGNVVLEVCKCIGHALSSKWRSKGETREHWLDFAEDKYGSRLIEDIKATLRVLFLYLPLPFFWALFDQQGSRWTAQATRMNGDVGFFIILPDQMQVVNPLLILAFIPLFETVIYPLLGKCNLLKKPLQKLGIGGILAALSFVISAFVEMQIQPTDPVLPMENEAQLRIFNDFNCKMTINNAELNLSNYVLEGLQVWESRNFQLTGNASYSIQFSAENCGNWTKEGNATIYASEQKATSYYFTYGPDPGEILLRRPSEFDTLKKSDTGYPGVRVVPNLQIYNESVKVKLFSMNDETSGTDVILSGTEISSNLTSLYPQTYKVSVNGTTIEDMEITVALGGVYTLLIYEDVVNTGTYKANLITVTSPNTVHMLWLIPQYVIITMGEIMFSITGLEFSFTQAPSTMKSVLQAAWLLTVAFGNLIVVIIAESKLMDSQVGEFFLFAGLMAVDMAVFALMAKKYKYVDSPNEEHSAQEDFRMDLAKQKNGVINKSFKHDD